MDDNMKRSVTERLIEAANMSDMGRKPDKKDYRRIAAQEISNLTNELHTMNTNYQLLLREHRKLKNEFKKLKAQK